ncbi:MAG TPA: hypothetical protein VF373_14140 [Prolixibacteraceae bacterium]
MSKFVIYILMFLPAIAFGQLFPKVADFKGNIEKVVEKGYGKEISYSRLFKGIYHPKTYSGWKYIYLFDQNSKLIKRINTFQGKVIADFLYQRDTIENRVIEREIIADNLNGHEGDYTEQENFLDLKGRIEKVNFRAFNAKECVRSMYQTEQNAEYKEGRLIAFTRQQINENGDADSGENINLSYGSSGKLIRTERKDNVSGFKTVIQYFYNNKGLVSHYSVDFLTELQEIGKNQIQDIYFKYDRHGNWTRKYWKTGKKKRLEARRFIKYR